MQMDQDYTAQDFMQLHQRQLMNAVTQEFAIKNHDENRWRRVTGAFFSYQWLHTDGPVGFGESMTGPMGNAIAGTIYTSIYSSTYNGILNKMIKEGMPEEVAKAKAKASADKAVKRENFSMGIGIDVPGTFRTPQLNAALFHESSLQLSNRLRATLGLRYDLSRTSIHYDTRAIMTANAKIMGQEAVNTLTSHLDSRTHNTFNELLPKLSFTYDLGKVSQSNGGNIGNLYASVSKGYRAGGYNIQMFSDILQTELMANRMKAMKGSYDIPHSADDYSKVNNTISYKPEESWNYEVGAHLNLFNEAAHLDFSAYYMQIKNQQLSVMAGTYGFGRMMVNAGRSRSFGGEITLRGSSFNNALAWALAYGYTNATFRNYNDGENDYRGNRVPFAPEHTLSANADYTILPQQSFLKSVVIGAGTTAQGEIYWDEANSYKQKFYALLNAHAKFGFKHFTVNLWAKNLTNTRYCTFAMDSSASRTKRYFGQKGAPVTFGTDFNFSF